MPSVVLVPVRGLSLDWYIQTGALLDLLNL
jgi:hypothetical protein